MFISHFAAGLGGKTLAPRVSLGTCFLAAQFVDLLWPTLLLLGLEQVRIEPGATEFTPLDFASYPISHSLLMNIVWGVVVGGLYFIIRRRTRGAIVLGALVLSHWFLDLIVHRPDLPLAFGDSPLFGLGLWNNIAATLALEVVLFGAAVALYVRFTRANDRTGTYAFWGLVAFLLVIQFTNAFGPLPPDEAAIAWTGQAQWLLVAWAYWIDRHRSARKGIPSRETAKAAFA